MPHPTPYCAALGIPVPDLARARTVARASLEPNPSSYALLLVALLERGAPMTLAEVAARFAEAGVATADDALASLKRCRSARPPVYRDGDHYALDPWAGAIRCFVDEGDRPYRELLVDADGWVLDPDDVQRVREAPGVWVDPPRRGGGKA